MQAQWVATFLRFVYWISSQLILSADVLFVPDSISEHRPTMSLFLLPSLVLFIKDQVNPRDMVPPLKTTNSISGATIPAAFYSLPNMHAQSVQACVHPCDVHLDGGLLRRRTERVLIDPDLNNNSSMLWRGLAHSNSTSTCFDLLDSLEHELELKPNIHPQHMHTHNFPDPSLHTHATRVSGAVLPDRVSTPAFSLHAHSTPGTCERMPVHPKISLSPMLYNTLAWSEYMLAYILALLECVQLAVLGVTLVIPMLCLCFFTVCWCICAVTLDAAKACFGALLILSTADPTTHVHVISCIIKRLISVMISRNMILFSFLISAISDVPCAMCAGKDTPSVNKQEFELPGMSRWSGIPFHDFRRIWWVALLAALGNVAQDSYTLLQTARDQDLGGPANPGTAAQRAQSVNRNQRLFGSILNYIEATSYIYRYASANFNNNGRGLFNYIYVFGHLPLTSEERTTLENEWTDATMASVGIAYKVDAVFKWAEYVDNLAGKLNKTERDKRVKYLAGFPASFDVMIIPERTKGAVGSYAHPTNYPTHHPSAGTAHPKAGQPDIMATAHAFYIEWSTMINKGQIRSVPKGSAYMANDTHSDDDTHESANMARDRVDSKTVCGICGGIGHAGTVDGVGQCLTARLNHRISSDVLSRIQYPEGFSAPKFMHRGISKSGRPGSSNQHSYAKRNYNPQSHRYSNSRPRARYIDDHDALEQDSHDSNSNSLTAQEIANEALRASAPESNPTAMQIALEAMRLANNFKSNSRFPPRRPGPAPRRSTKFNRPRANAIERENERDFEDAQQNVDHDANESDDDDEHARLAVDFDAVEF